MPISGQERRMAIKSFVVALFVALSPGFVAAQFSCFPVDPCFDDPTFLFLGFFPCGSTIFDLCAEVSGLNACGESCLSCPICEDPDPIDGIDIIVQYAEVAPGVLSVYVDAKVDIGAFQGVLSCISSTTGKRLNPEAPPLLK